MKHLIALIINLTLINSVISQQLSYQVSPILGYKFQKNSFFSEPILGFTFDLNRKTTGEKYWQSDHRFPQMGLQFMLRDFAENSPHRFTFSLIPYLEFNFFKSQTGILQLKHGTGLAYVAGQNSENINTLLGSKLNASSIIDVGYNFFKGKHLDLKPGLMISHVSNGNLVNPNKGINAVFAYLQLKYALSTRDNQVIYNEKINVSRKWRPEYRLSLGIFDYVKEDKMVGLKIQHMFLTTYTHNTRFRTGFGAEVMHDDDFSNPILSIYADESVLIGHLVTRYGIGVYITDIPVNSSRIYEKVGLVWFPFKLKDAVGQGFSIGADIKAHKFKAVMIDLNVGYLF